MWSRGLPLGVDFKGGSILILKFDQAVSEDAVRSALAALPGDKTVQKYGAATANEILIRLPQTVEREEGASLERDVKAATAAVAAANIGKFDVIGTEVVGPIIGAQLQRKGIYATLFSILGITIYIAFRFRFTFAIGAIVATFHDILVTLAFLAFFGYELSLNVVAAILTITGYSVNDTIVIFDRVRENFRFMRRDSLEHVVNTSVNQTLGRTIITAGTTFLAVLSLFLFGGDVLEGFAFTMLVGIISGTYSTVFIAAAIAIILSRKKAEARVQAAPAAAADTDGAGRRKNGKKAR
jgi:preprotein translocase subunit SecF